MVARIIAALAFIAGVAEYALGFAIATGVVGSYEAALARYTTFDSSGQMINHAIYLVGFALALGTLAEVGIAVRKLAAR